jgi:hypothetical protein
MQCGSRRVFSFLLPALNIMRKIGPFFLILSAGVLISLFYFRDINVVTDSQEEHIVKEESETTSETIIAPKLLPTTPPPAVSSLEPSELATSINFLSRPNAKFYMDILNRELATMTDAEKYLVLSYARHREVNLDLPLSSASLQVQSAYEAQWLGAHGFPSIAEQNELIKQTDAALQASVDQGNILAVPFLADRKNRKGDIAGRDQLLRDAKIRGSIAAIYEEIRYIELKRRRAGSQSQLELNSQLAPLILLLDMMGDQTALDLISRDKRILDSDFRAGYFIARNIFASIQIERFKRGLPALLITPRLRYR